MDIKCALKVIGAKVYQNRAKIETVAGMLLVATGTGIIISKAVKATEITYDLQNKVDDIRERDAKHEWTDRKDRSAAVKAALSYGAKGYTKTYWLGLTCVAGGLTLIGISDITMSNEITAAWGLASAYAATLTNVKDRVIADQGEEKWQQYLLGPQFETVDVMPDGTIIQTTNPVENPNIDAGLPPHCFFFDESNPNWEKDPYINRDFLEKHERWLNQKLECEEFLFENDIRRDIGADLVKSGWTSGIMKWRIDPVTGDRVRNYISFGLDAKNPAAQAFRDGVEPTILIQLNVEDNIIDQLNLALI